MPVIPFGEWLPDQQDYGNTGCLTATNCLPGANSYKPVGALSTVSNAIDARPQGATTLRDADNQVRKFCGDAAKLYELVGTTWTDRSLSGGYGTAAEDNWYFTQWKNKLIATNYSDYPQAITLGGSNFANLTTDFKARAVNVVRDFVVFGNTFDFTDNFVRNRVRWSAFNDETDYTVSTVTLSGYEDLKSGGQVQRIVGGEYGVIVCESSVYRMQYVGSPVAFQFDETLPGIGTFAPNGVARLGDIIYFPSEQGFIALTGGASPTFIGQGKVDQFFRSDLDDNYHHRISASVDPKSGRVFWAYPGAGNTSGRPNKIICYDRVFNKWSIIEDEVELIWRAGGTSLSLDDLDSISASLDDLEFSLDSDAWKGGAPQISAFQTDFKHGFFNGSNMSATFTTKEWEAHQGRRAAVNAIEAVVEGGTVTAEIGTRRKLTDSVSWGSSISQRDSGKFTQRNNSRFHRVRLTCSGSWTDAVGIYIDRYDSREAGRRG